MAWVRLDDRFPDHPKIMRVGPLAGWLFVCGLCYCNAHLTDGFIPRAKARHLADLDDPEATIATLLNAGLWEPAEGGYQVHDYLDYQPSAAQSAVRRNQNADRQRSWRDRHAVSNASRNDVTNGRPVPNPVPVPNPPTPSPDAGARAREGAEDAEEAQAEAEQEAIAAALAEHVAPPTTPSEQEAHDLAVMELHQARASPEEIARRARAYRERWPTTLLTVRALTRHWSVLNGHHEPDADARSAERQQRETEEIALAQRLKAERTTALGGQGERDLRRQPGAPPVPELRGGGVPGVPAHGQHLPGLPRRPNADRSPPLPDP